jgi:hypothetical protein
VRRPLPRVDDLATKLDCPLRCRGKRFDGLTHLGHRLVTLRELGLELTNQRLALSRPAGVILLGGLLTQQRNLFLKRAGSQRKVAGLDAD